MPAPDLDFDTIIIGAGISGLYQLYRLREIGQKVRVFEAGTGVGGTWYWNRYPGCRFDSESYSYGYSFSQALLDEWDWTEHFAPQPETERYLNYVTDKFDLRRDIQFRSRMKAATWDEHRRAWDITLEDGARHGARYLVTAVGPLSAPTLPHVDFVGSRSTICREIDLNLVESGHAPVNGISMYYEVHGPRSSVPLVLLHGGGSTIQVTFSRILPVLAGSRRVIALEEQAHGRTTDRDAPVGFESSADDVAALLGHLKVDQADILGFSNGASVALQVAIRHPRLVRKLVFASSMTKRAGAHPQLWEFMKQAAFANMPQPLKDAFLAVNPDVQQLETMHDKDAARMQGFEDVSDDAVRSIRVPTLIVLGDRDIVRPEHALELTRLIPEARLLILPGGHGDYLGEAVATQRQTRYPELTARLIEEFLESTGEGLMATSTVRLHRVLRATPEKVYRAFLDPDAMVKWLPPNGFTGKVHHMDARVGGTYKMSFTNFASGHSHSFGGTFLELVPHERIRHTDAFDDPSLPGEMQTTISLKKVSCGTEMSIVQEGIPETIPPEACYLGWQESLALLTQLVEAEIPG